MIPPPPQKYHDFPEIGKFLMLPVECWAPVFPCLVSEKLNGVFACYIPGYGFYTKRGKRWMSTCLPHLKQPALNYPVCGELYCPGMSLQDINARVAVNRTAPHNNVECIQFHLHDMIIQLPALNRHKLLDALDLPFGWFTVPQYRADRQDQLDEIEAKFRARDAEGAIVKHTHSGYHPGSSNVFKRPYFKMQEMDVEGYLEGEGKCAGMVGAVIVKHGGKQFCVGTMQFGFEQRTELWQRKPLPATADIRYKTLSDDGCAQNASVYAIYES